MNYKYFLTFIILFIASSCFAQNVDTFTINSACSRIHKGFHIEASMDGKLKVINRDIFFLISNKRSFIKDIKIPIDSIAYITNFSYYFFWIVTKDSCKYKIGTYGKRKLFRKIDNLTEGGITIKKVKHITNKSTVEKGNNKVKIPFIGSTLFTPIWVSIDIENFEDKIILKPIEYTCFLQPVYINKNDIKEIKKKKNNKWVIVLHSGLKYKIMANSVEKLFDGY